MKRNLFGTDGIRGIAGTYPLDAPTIQKLGYAASQVLQTNNLKKVIIGRDTRESGQWIFNAISQGFEHGCMEVLDAGVVPTPLVSILTKKLGCTFGVVISASHNPYEYNGIKFFSSSGEKLSDDIEHKIEIAMEKSPCFCDAKTTSKNLEENTVESYKKFLISTLPSDFSLKGMRIVIDCANGALFEIAPQFFKNLGADIIVLGVKPDGKNINKNCGSLHREKLFQTIRDTQAHCGFAFDGDGDRVLASDEKGADLDGDFIMAILADFLKKKKQLKANTLVVTLMTNIGLRKAMTERGITIAETGVGDRYVYQKMQELDACIGGEQSGHIILRDYSVTGDGMLTALHFLHAMKSSGKRLSELSKIMQKFPQILVNVRVKKRKELFSIPELAHAYEDMQKTLGDSGRVVIRYSGTEPLIRIMIEGENALKIREMAENYAGLAKKHLE